MKTGSKRHNHVESEVNDSCLQWNNRDRNAQIIILLKQ